ncbi:MAG: translation elongation factor 4 [Candidatus Pacebacteria bacterium]|nr:translation elongation factor 4 [Candidatus Paceibacterota bacterium]
MKEFIDTIRNFAIIAHIDHGKSTIADRFLLHTHTISERDFHDQVLDDMDLEQERGITIKSHPVRMVYERNPGESYRLNLIDTPGHVDFSYEVSRSLAACEGALLVIDAAQGVQAQTVANVNLAMQLNLEIIPDINKIDLPAADPETCLVQMEEILALPADDALLVSAKDDIGIDDLLEAIVDRIPAPPLPEDERLRALVFDSVYNPYRGVISYVRVVSGSTDTGNPIQLFTSKLETEVKETGFFRPKMTPVESLSTGDVGYIITSIKDPADIRIGDTITSTSEPCNTPLPGFKELQPMVFSGVYPIDTRDFDSLKLSISKLQLNDAAFVAQPETSAALGPGFRCGFLGLLHMEIVQERLRREYNMDIIVTYPSVVYRVALKDGDVIELENPAHLPDPTDIDHIQEPIINAKIITPTDYLGNVMQLIMEKRGDGLETHTVDERHVLIHACLPLHEIVIEFYDRLKTITRGYGSMDYERAGYRTEDLARLEILVNGETVDAFASIVHRDHAAQRGRQLAERLKEVIPQQLYQIAIQAAVGGKIVARENVRALRKNVTAKCYGGDITRKRKLLEKQKAGKKRMKQVGKVEIPQDAFVAVLKAKE